MWPPLLFGANGRTQLTATPEFYKFTIQALRGELNSLSLQSIGPLALHSPGVQSIMAKAWSHEAIEAWSHYGAAPTDITWMKWAETISEIKG